MIEKRSLVDIFEDQTYGIRNTGYSDQLTDIPKLITENLKYTPYYFQKEAIENFVFYMDADENPVTKSKIREKNEPVHLMFNMATGSGKTLIMAANIVFLISKGYKKFLFITNQTNILNKTKENLTNSQHQKYLFKEKIIIDSKIINLKEVDKFSNTDSYEIRFTTIHKLHAELSPTNIRENTNSQDELNKLNLVILADEAHHFNVESSGKNSQKQTDENSKPEDIEVNWEATLINKVFNKNFSELVNNNVLLEYTATVPNNENIENKYLDKTIYRFDLKKFMTAKLTKEINLVTLSLDRKQKIIYALSFNWYRHKLALKYNIPNFKPVILFRRKLVEESNDDFEYFFEVVENLELNDLSFFELDIPKNSNSGSVHEQGLSRTQEIYNLLKTNKAKNEFIQYVKNNFKRDINVVITNSKTNKTKKERLEKNLESELNNLEAPNNNIRAIFTVKRLTEGWDVQNLYDIVRMDTTQNTGGKSKSTPPATVEEKQLIGRAVRFNPYKLNNEKILKRQFDDNLDNELRILEEFYYFTYDEESRYISELKTELVREGYIKEKNELINFQLKNSFTKKQFYKNTSLWINSQISGEKYYLSSLNELEEIVEINLPDLSISEERLGSNLESISTAQFSGNFKEFDININIFDNHIVLKSLNRLNKSFKDIIQLLEVESYSQLNKNKILNQFTLRISSVHKSIETMNGAEKLFILEMFFETLLSKLDTLLNRKYGDTSFTPVLLSDFFTKPKQKSIDTENFSVQSVNVLREIENESWYVVEATKKDTKEKLAFLPSTDQELNFLELFKAAFTIKLDEISEEYYLIRNEEQFKLFDFNSGEGFMPDFLLFIKLNKELIYLIFIEPKGQHLFEKDKWKEEFLEAIDGLHGLNAEKLKKDNIAYNLIGLPFYNSEQSESFRDKFQEILN